MATAWGYQAGVYRAFLGTLRATGYAGDIRIFAPPNRTSDDALSVCAEHGAMVDDSFRLDRVTRPSAERFLYFERACSSGGYTLCMTTDFRDVFFQADPFARARAAITLDARRPDLVIPLDCRWPLGKDLYNADMVRKCVGHNHTEGRMHLAEIFNATVLCSGVLIATPQGLTALTVSKPQRKRPYPQRCRSRCPHQRVGCGTCLCPVVRSVWRRSRGWQHSRRTPSRTRVVACELIPMRQMLPRQRRARRRGHS